jgi:glycosyltransferase involved in cell wall biosynthesis
VRYVLVSDTEYRGGAGIAAGRLASALAARGHDLYWVAARAGGRAGGWTFVPFRLEGSLRAVDVAARRGPAGLRRRLHPTLVERPLRRLLESLDPDVVNLHNVHGAGWQPGVLDAVPARTAALWTLHDMWPFTGRCTYAFECRRFLEGCTAACPTPGEYPALDPKAIAAAWQSRAAVLRRRPDAVAVCPSRWLTREAQAGLWKNHRVVHIPNGVPTDSCVPVPRATARRTIGMNDGERVVAVMAERLAEPRKGWTYLEDALRRLPEPRLHVLLIGEGGQRVCVPAPHKGIAAGTVDDPVRQRLLLSAAECLVHPAPVDNLPNVVLEAMACGIPTVAFPVGGLPDMVRPGVTGWLARDVSAEALAAVLAQALAHLGAAGMESSCRQVAASEYGTDLQAQRYEALVASLDSSPPSAAR